MKKDEEIGGLVDMLFHARIVQDKTAAEASAKGAAAKAVKDSSDKKDNEIKRLTEMLHHAHKQYKTTSLKLTTSTKTD